MAVDQSKLTEAQLGIAEGEYSRTRLRALADEWSADYPFLLDFAKILERQPTSFSLAALANRTVEDCALEVVAANPSSSGILIDLARAMVEGHLPIDEFKCSLFHVFYKIGLVGVKLAPHEAASWRDDAGQAVSRSQVTGETSIVANPAYVRALGMTLRHAA